MLFVQPLVRQLEHLCLEKDNDGNTPLHLAAGLGNMQAMENGLLNAEIWDEGASSDVEDEGSEGESEGGSEGESEGRSDGEGEEEERDEQGSMSEESDGNKKGEGGRYPEGDQNDSVGEGVGESKGESRDATEGTKIRDDEEDKDGASDEWAVVSYACWFILTCYCTCHGDFVYVYSIHLHVLHMYTYNLASGASIPSRTIFQCIYNGITGTAP